MPILTLDQFVERRTGDREPLFDGNWYVKELPFGGELDYVETVNLPFPSLNVKPLFYGSRTLQFPGFLEVSSFDITFYEDVRARTRLWLKEWQERIREPNTGAYYLPAMYKRDIVVCLCDGTSLSDAILTVRLKDCWPSTSSPFNLTNTGGQILKVQQNFAIDGVEYE